MTTRQFPRAVGGGGYTQRKHGGSTASYVKSPVSGKKKNQKINATLLKMAQEDPRLVEFHEMGLDDRVLKVSIHKLIV